MRRQGHWGWVLAVAVSLGLAACVIDNDDSGSVGGVVMGTAGRVVDAGDQVCTPGETQICHGPGACEGAQRCELHGLSWGPCDCGDSGSGGAPDEPMGNGGTAGAEGDGGDGNAGAAGGGGPPAAVSCEDGVQNADETDVDCGGGICPPCPPGMSCQAGADCTSGSCTDGICEEL